MSVLTANITQRFEDFESHTKIATDTDCILQLAQDIINIKEKSALEIADDADVHEEEEHDCKVQSFEVHGRSVAKVTVLDCDVYEPKPKFYAASKISKKVERTLDDRVGKRPSLEVTRCVAAQLLLELGGELEGSTDDYWMTARDLAQERLWRDNDLEAQVESEMETDGPPDDAFEKMIVIVREGLKTHEANPYYQAKRDEEGVELDEFRCIDADIVMVLDKCGKVIAFFFAEAFRILLSAQVQELVVASFETMSTMFPVPYPDKVRHGLHFVSWLIQHPEFDFRSPGAELRLAKSGV